MAPYYNYNTYANQFLAFPITNKILNTNNVNIGVNDIIKDLNYQLTKKVEKPQKIDIYI